MLSRLMTRREQALILGLAVAIVIGSITLYVDRTYWEPMMAPLPQTHVKKTVVQEVPLNEVKLEREVRVRKPVLVPPAPAPAPAADLPQTTTAERVDVTVGIIGAVRKPGLYTLRPSDQVSGLITAAGGLTETADTRTINLAAPLIDGTTLSIPDRTSQQGTGGADVNPVEYLALE